MLLYKNTGHVEPATNFRLGKSGQPMINQNIEKIKEAFFSQLSHNLMTHASNIIGFSELMKNEELRQEDKLQYIQFVIELSNMILTLAEDVKSLNKLSPESFALNESKANLNSFMDEIYNAAQNSNEAGVFRFRHRARHDGGAAEKAFRYGERFKTAKPRPRPDRDENDAGRIGRTAPHRIETG